MKVKSNRIDERLKFYTYIVCNTKLSAKDRMIEDYWYYCQRFGWKDFIKINRSKLKIESKQRVWQYVSVREVLFYFDGVDEVDRFELDDSVSSEKADTLVRAVKILKLASVPKFQRVHERERYYEEHYL